MTKDPSKSVTGPVFHNIKASNGSRMFLSFHSFGVAKDMWNHLRALPEAKQGKLTSGFDEMWFTFSFRGYVFSVHDHWSGTTFFADDPATPEAYLREIMMHFATFS